MVKLEYNRACACQRVRFLEIRLLDQLAKSNFAKVVVFPKGRTGIHQPTRHARGRENARDSAPDLKHLKAKE
jgi:hypothetical protein